MFSQLAQAYEVLSDTTKRRQYDLTGETDDQRREKSPEFGRTYEEHPFGLFVRFRGGSFKLHYRGTGVKGMPPTTIPVHVSLEDLLKPRLFNTTVNRQVICPMCMGTGASSPENLRECPVCGGSGMGYHLHEEPACASCQKASASDGSDGAGQGVASGGKRGWRGFRQASHSWCKACDGVGKISDKGCPKCGGQSTVVEQVEMSIWVPAGAPDGTQIVQANEGNQHQFRKVRVRVRAGVGVRVRVRVGVRSGLPLVNATPLCAPACVQPTPPPSKRSRPTQTSVSSTTAPGPTARRPYFYGALGAAPALPSGRRQHTLHGQDDAYRGSDGNEEEANLTQVGCALAEPRASAPARP